MTVVLAADDGLFARVIDTNTTGLNTVIGGASRAMSVMNGLNSIHSGHPDTEWVLVHDAARPCLSRSCLASLLEKGLQEADGAILAIPVRDTLKEMDDAGYIHNTVDRNELWVAQTPQLFPIDRLSAAMESMLSAGTSPTDEAAAMEFSGAHPLLVMGSPANIKITLPDDLAIAEAWFTAMKASEPDTYENRNLGNLAKEMVE